MKKNEVKDCDDCSHWKKDEDGIWVCTLDINSPCPLNGII